MKAWRHSRRTSVVDTFLDFSTLKFAWKPVSQMQIRCSHGAVRRAERAPQRRDYSICEMGSISLTRITGHFCRETRLEFRFWGARALDSLSFNGQLFLDSP